MTPWIQIIHALTRSICGTNCCVTQPDHCLPACEAAPLCPPPSSTRHAQHQASSAPPPPPPYLSPLVDPKLEDAEQDAQDEAVAQVTQALQAHLRVWERGAETVSLCVSKQKLCVYRSRGTHKALQDEAGVCKNNIGGKSMKHGVCAAC
jgi:hypothetical protein